HAHETAQVVARQTELMEQLGDSLNDHLRGYEQRLIEQLAELGAQLDRHRNEAQEGSRGFARRHEELVARQAAQSEQFQSQLGELADLIKDRSRALQTETQAKIAEEIAQRQQEQSLLSTRLDESARQWRDELQALTQLARHWREEIRGVETALHQADLLQREQFDSTSKNFQRELGDLLQKHQEMNVELVLQRQRMSSLIEEASKRLPTVLGERQLKKVVAEEAHLLDAFYASFDERFRGSRDEIKRRLRVYLPVLNQHAIGTAAMPVLDVGCGRGEWLEVLKEHGLEASGIDSNRVLANRCREQGLAVVEADLLEYLPDVADGTFGAVTGFHIVEHLPLEELAEFLDQTVRILKPVGLVIFETPNPQNVLVGSCNFYFDLTHRNPIPSQVLSFLLESRGFLDVQVMNLNPSDDTPVDDDSDLARRFNQYFYGPMDYAVIG